MPICMATTAKCQTQKEDKDMRIFGLILSLAVLAACDPTYQPRPEPADTSSGSGIKISGYGRVGVSTSN